MPAVQRFMARYPGTLTSPGAHPGLPWWVDAQHFLNALFMIFIIIRAGIQILADHGRLHWTRHCTPWAGLVPVPEAGPGRPAAVDGQAGPGQPARPGRPAGAAAFDRAGPLVAPGHRRAVAGQRRDLLRAAVRHRAVAPDRAHHVEGVPSAVTVLIQYLSLRWPAEGGWTAYNSLQLIAYFITCSWPPLWR
jgi:methionine sulfoxide reductase catalytic subunit